MFAKNKYVTEATFDLQFDIVMVQDNFQHKFSSY